MKAMNDRQQLEKAIALQESLRGTIDDAILNATIAALREKLAELDAPKQQRKLVTVLFADIVGSTRIIRDLDPEENLEIMDGTLKRLTIPVEEHGGHVTRFMGDGFKAVFGAPKARENDPEMAIRAGLGILQAIQILSSEMERRWGIHDLQVRIGITTGLVALGGMTEAEDTMMGKPVNLAARLESAAPPGGLLISHDTYRHVRGIFEVEAQEPIEVKGFDEPVPVYLVKQIKPRAFRTRSRGVEGVQTRMVGREVELQILQNAYKNAVEGKQTSIVTVIGEAGVGKSRLLYEFDNWIDLLPEEVRFFKGNSVHETQNVPYALLRDLFSFGFRIQEGDEAESVRQKVFAGFSEAFGMDDVGQRKAHISGQLLGYDFSESPYLKGLLENPQLIHDRGLIYIGEYFKAISEQEPVIISLEDIHWADNSSLDTINWLVRKLPDQRLLIICLARHRLFDLQPGWGKELNCHQRLDLQSLTQHQSGQLIVEILQKVTKVPAGLRDLVVKNAEGNPYYIEELIKMLIEDSVIITGPEHWQIEADRLIELEVPATLTGVLQARLDGLPPRERELLQQASVVGRTFWDNAVRYINTEAVLGEQQAEGDSLVDDLSLLCRRELIYRQEVSAFADAREYIFKHALLRDVTYETVLLRQRQAYHGLVAQWLIQFVGERAEEYTSLIADHYHQAGDYENAFQYYSLAGHRAAHIYANDEAIMNYTRAIESSERISPDVLQVAELLRGRGLVFERIGEFESARADHEATLQIARETGESQVEQVKIEWRALIDLGKLWASRDYNRARDYLERALELAREMADPVILASSLNWMGNWYANNENPKNAIAAHQEAMNILEDLGDKRELANALDLLGLANMLGADLTTCAKYCDRAIVLFTELDDRPRLASSLTVRATTVSALAWLASIAPAPAPDAAADFNEAIRITGEIGLASGQAWAYYSLGMLHTVQGNFGRANMDIQSSLHIASEIRHREYIVGAQSALGIWYSVILASEQARNQLGGALDLARELRSPTWIHIVSGELARAYLMQDKFMKAKACLDTVISAQTPMDTLGKRLCWTSRAELALAQGDTTKALEIVERIITSAPGIKPGDVITFLWLLKGEALAALGQLEEANALLSEALENAQTNDERFLLWRVHASLGRLYKVMDQQAKAEDEFSAAEALIAELASTIPDEGLRDSYLQGAKKTIKKPTI